VVIVALLSACGGGAARVATPPPAPDATTTEPTTPDAPQMESCVASERGYRLTFPASWSTNESAVAEPCRFFHPEAFVLPPQTEATGIAVNVRLNPVAFDEVVPSPGGSAVAEMLDRRVITIDGRRAIRSKTRSAGRALLPLGTIAVRWFVDAGDATLVAATSEAAAAGRFDDNVNVLDAMMQSLRILERPATCSARRSAPESTPQAELPQAVAAMRTAIRTAAKVCDYDELAALALAGDSQFTYSFGSGGAPAAFWRGAEAAGRAPMRTLIEILDAPFASRPVEAGTQYVWPSAYAYERWDDVPAAERKDLMRLYGEEDILRFEQFGSYLGERVGITAGGDWLFFVGGD